MCRCCGFATVKDEGPTYDVGYDDDTELPNPIAPLSDLDPKRSASSSKDPMDLLPHHVLAAAARVLRTGAAKYGPWNWRHNRIKVSTYVAAIRRHVGEWQEGRDADPESGEHPLAHALASCIVVLDAMRQGTLEDDRPPRPGPLADR